MQRVIVVYGSLAGAIAIGSIILGIALSGGGAGLNSFEWLGYLIMLLALSLIFVSVKRYRDQELGGTITFGKATLFGLGVTAVAGVVYVGVWEIYLLATNYSFIEIYTDGQIAGEQAKGLSGAELDALVAEMEAMKISYANPLFRVPLTFLEIFPVGLLVTLISAAVLRNRNVLPASEC